ncbi:acetate kinase [Halospina denitrificans]|uniref:Acetate kinase n=1 Tax=Halospina denitrificans TaxID=332522 RepID=A0A4R7JUL9_9GAMM|nr:acetate kinase [Halospina denitrificans]TDT41624.1 acetate kinase [Halospina denitrificans]
MGDHQILIVNSGSSSLKLSIASLPPYQVLASLVAERLGTEKAILRMEAPHQIEQPLRTNATHRTALEACLTLCQKQGLLTRAPDGVGHRVVHGGETFTQSTRVTDTVISAIEECVPLAPLHNPANLEGIQAMRAIYPDVPQVAVFDTAFHQTLPRHAYLYALPYALYQDQGVRRYGFHGTSHRFMVREAARMEGQSEDDTCLISAHLGNGCSITAIRHGRSVDTSMGLTPLEGLVMGTRSGDIDPGVFDFLYHRGWSPDQINGMLNRDSGLKGLSGLSNDMRTLTEAADTGNDRAALAVEVFCFRLARYIGAMMASLPRLDALVFTGGIGENSATVRARTLSHLALLGFGLDESANQCHGAEHGGAIHAHGQHPVLVIPTDEEQVIAMDTAQITRST